MIGYGEVSERAEFCGGLSIAGEVSWRILKSREG